MADPSRRPPADALEPLRRLGYREAHPRSGAHRRARRARRRWPRRALIGVNVVTALCLVVAGSAFGYIQWRLGQLSRVHIYGLHPQGRSSQSGARGPAAAFTLLVIGSDTRNLGTGGGAQFGSDTQVGGQRSDSIILIRLAPRSRSLALLSIPRDTLVQIPGYGRTRINTAFNSGTPSLLVQVLDQDFGIQVNHVAEFNFDTFRAVADAVGGVEQYFPAPARDLYSLLDIPAAGCYNLTGNQALGFVRSREYQYLLDGVWHYQLYPESDLARIQRQQAFARDLARKARKVAPTDLVELNSIISGITRNLTLDSGFSNSLILSLARDYRRADLSAIPSYTYPAVNSTSVPGALDPQTQQGRAVIKEWLDLGRVPSPPPVPVPGAASPPPAPTASPAYDGTATVDPASSSTYHGVYVPPGLLPGQTPQTCGE